ncbi:hypothetical protein [Amycolatopsis sp.]|uniref:hypothetical protein n=1 Tax=Amycolatopsis sp. TaxID=37632 RepID=UPI002D808BAD|nr:hypothetical protein [Amycolatopsis sp.]HET6706379.1 hypothetical protein [Amycolatopsis sp.]
MALLLVAAATSWFLMPHKYGLPSGMLLLAAALTVNQLIAGHRSRRSKAGGTGSGPASRR